MEFNDYPDFSQLFSYVAVFSAVITMLYYFLVSPILSPLCIKSYRSWPNHIQRDFDTRLFSTLHAISATTLSLWVIVFDQDGNIENQIVLRSALGQTALKISLGYFIGDLLVMLSDRNMREQYEMLLHHVTSIISVSLGLVYGGIYMMLLMMRLCSEVSAPFVNIRQIFAAFNVPKTSKKYMAVEILVTLTFFLARILPIPVQWWYLVQFIHYEFITDSFTTPLFLKLWTLVGSIIMDAMNICWAWEMIATGLPRYGWIYRKKKE